MLHSIIQKRPANYMELQTIQNRIVVLENRTAELLQEKENKVLAAQFELKEARQQWCQTARRDSHTIADLMKDKEELTKAIERLRKDHESQAQCSRDQRAEHARQKEGWQRDRQKLESQVQSLINQHTTLVRGKDKKMDVMKEKCEEIDKSRHAEEIQKSNLLIQIKYLQGKVDKGEDLHMQNVSLQSEVASLTLDLEKQAAKLKSEEERLKSLVERSELEKDKTAKEIAGLNEKRKECLRREEALHTQVQALQGCLKDSDTEVKRLKEINNLLGTQAAEVEELNASLEIQVKTLAEEQLRSVEETQNAKRHSRHMGSQLKKLRQDFETYRKSHTQEHLAKLREAEESLSKYDELAASMQSLAEKRKVDNDSSERSYVASWSNYPPLRTIGYFLMNPTFEIYSREGLSASALHHT